MDLARLVIGFLPVIGDTVDGLEQLYFVASGQNSKVDPVVAVLSTAGLALDLATGGVGDLTSIFKGAYRVSLLAAKSGGGVVSAVLRREFTTLMAGAISPITLKNSLNLKFGRIVAIGLDIRSCGFLGYKCFGLYDEIGSGYRRTRNTTPETSLQQFNDDLSDRSFGDFTNKDRLDDLGACRIGITKRGDLVGPQNSTPRRIWECPTVPVGGTARTQVTATVPGTTTTIKFNRPEQMQYDVVIPVTVGRPLKVNSTLFKATSIAGDQRGHIIPKALNGSGSQSNYFPVNSVLNEGRMAALERALVDFAKRRGSSFRIKWTFGYPTGTSTRPSTIKYEFFDTQVIRYQSLDTGPQRFSTTRPPQAPMGE